MFPKQMGALVGLISAEGDRVQLTLYARERRRPVAVVIGSSGYVLLALVAVGLAAAPASLRDGQRALLFTSSMRSPMTASSISGTP